MKKTERIHGYPNNYNAKQCITCHKKMEARRSVTREIGNHSQLVYIRDLMEESTSEQGCQR